MEYGGKGKTMMVGREAKNTWTVRCRRRRRKN